MIFSVIEMMSLTATIVIIFYFIFYRIARKNFPVEWRYTILKISLFFFLCPVSLFKYDILQVLYLFFPGFAKGWIFELDNRIHYSDIVFRFQSNYYVSTFVKIKWCCVTLVGLISLFLIIAQLYKYYKAKKFFKILRQCTIKDNFIQEQVKKQKNHLKIKKEIDIIISDLNDTPCTIGIMNPIICLPLKIVNSVKQEDLFIIILHELIHIKNRDLLIKFIGLFVIAVNWFNPLCYFVFFEICAMSEICCDSELLKERDEAFINDYCTLLIDIAATKSFPLQEKFSSGLVNGDKKVIKRRIMEMKRKRNKITRFLPALLSVLIFMFAGTTAFAYGKTPRMDVEGKTFTHSETSSLAKNNWAQFSADETENTIITAEYGNYFVTQDGSVEKVNIDDQVARHSHIYVDGFLYIHAPQVTGCKMDCYNAKKCTICGYSIVNDLVSSTTYVNCSH